MQCLPAAKLSDSVLVVDDEVELLDIARTYLEQIGYTVLSDRELVPNPVFGVGEGLATIKPGSQIFSMFGFAPSAFGF
jgi:hypothetical protein